MEDLTRKVMEACAALARMSEERGRTTRTFLSAPMREVHRYLGKWMEGLGMRVRVDAAGNLRGVYGANRDGALLVGSHLDTVPNAGAFDGVLGVALGIALVEALRGRHLPFALEVIGFSEEEGVRFGTPFLGSRALVGTFDTLLELTDASGVTVAQAIRDFGLDPAEIPAAQGNYLGYLECHIEQGPVLEAEGLSLGVVTAIAGQSRLELLFEGQAAHAGTTPMELRRDALAGAATFVLAAERKARETPGLVATVGGLQVLPGASNVVAGAVRLSLDLRHAVDGVRTQALEDLLSEAKTSASGRGLELSWKVRFDQAAVPLDARLQGLLTKALEQEGHPAFPLVSGAGHDAMIVAERMPAAMLFLRSPGGLSHHPEEAVREGDVTAALRVGLSFLHLLEENA